MTETLSSLFQKSKGAPIEIDGRVVQSIFKTKISRASQTFLVRRVKAKDSPRQGVRVKVAKGEVEVNEQRHQEIILWADTSPESLVITVHAKPECELKIWNVWMVDEIVQAWVGNSGIIVSGTEAAVTLECSDGYGQVDFSCLIIEMVRSDD